MCKPAPTLIEKVQAQAAAELAGDDSRVAGYINEMSNEELLELVSRALEPRRDSV